MTLFAPRRWSRALDHWRSLLSLAVAAWLGNAPAARGDNTPVTSLFDGCCDAVARPTDPDANGPYDTSSNGLIDLLRIDAGLWRPSNPEQDLFSGQFRPCADFVRIDVVLAGLVNPPGRILTMPINPRLYGDRPVFGFVEIDMDHDGDTGGELAAPQYRFLSNVVRFGGKPTEGFPNRVACESADVDEWFLTPPYIERHGEEFHLALLGTDFGLGDIDVIVGNGNHRFEAGEVWNITGPLFHRAHGYEWLTEAGEYAPDVVVRFSHDAAANVTTISMVMPANQSGAAQWHGEPEQPFDASAWTHASLEEAFDDLWLSAGWLESHSSFLPEEVLIMAWKDKDYYAEFVDPAGWKITALLGASYFTPQPSGAFFVWTDVYPNVRRGDVNGDGAADLQDQQAIGDFIIQEDGADGLIDGRVCLPNFAADFSVFDINYDGIVDGCDTLLPGPDGTCDDGDVCTTNDVCFDGACAGTPIDCDDGVFCNSAEVCAAGVGCVASEPPCPVGTWCREASQSCELYGSGDFDADGDVDFLDFGKFQLCFNTSTNPGCEPGNMVGGENIDADDFILFVSVLGGPQ